MQLLSLSVCVLGALLRTTAARTVIGCELIPGETTSASPPGSHFVAPPLEVGKLAVYAILLFGSLVQLGFVIPSLFQTRYGHRIPGAATIVVLVLLATAYALGIADVITDWTITDCGNTKISSTSLANIEMVMALFSGWADPAVFAAVALVLRDRGLIHSSSPTQTTRPALPITIMSCILTMLVFILSTAYAVTRGSALIAVADAFTSLSAFNDYAHLITASNNLYYAYVALYIVATLFLVAFAIIVKKHHKGDKIASVTLVMITPLLVLRALAQLILLIVQARLTFSERQSLQDAYDLDFAGAFLDGVLYLAVTGVLVFYLMRPWLWDVGGGHLMLHDIGANAHQHPPTHPQFPAQWGSNGKPGGNSMPYPRSVDGGYSYRADTTRNPDDRQQEPPSPEVESPFDDEKAPDGLPYSHAAHALPPVTS